MCIHAADGDYMYQYMLHSWPKYVVKYNLCAINKLGFIPAKMEALNQCWVGVGPPFTTLAQHRPDNGSALGMNRQLTGFTRAF